MKPGWKNRIEERRYFEELRAKQSRRTLDNLGRRAQETARSMQYEIEAERLRKSGRLPFTTRFA